MARKADPTKRLGKALNVRASADDIQRLDSLVQRIGPGLVTRHGLARIVLRLGMAALEEDPMRIVQGVVSCRK
jgi:hypothetical protein